MPTIQVYAADDNPLKAVVGLVVSKHVPDLNMYSTIRKFQKLLKVFFPIMVLLKKKVQMI
jgi:hypothetical protein